MSNNSLLLPELIINKNKINFGSKSFKINQGEEIKSSARGKGSVSGAPSGHNVSADKMHGGQKTKRKRKKEASNATLM